jgi:hypothetical protein
VGEPHVSDPLLAVNLRVAGVEQLDAMVLSQVLVVTFDSIVHSTPNAKYGLTLPGGIAPGHHLRQRCVPIPYLDSVRAGLTAAHGKVRIISMDSQQPVVDLTSQPISGEDARGCRT